MRNVKLVVSYEGKGYAGWQVQDGEPTIQAALEEALAKITGHTVKLKGSGRTDAGVHAEGQVANFFTESQAPLKAFVRGVNSLIPDDISVISAQDVPPGFDSRRSALFKVYRYSIVNTQAPPASLVKRCWWVSGRLDVALMDRAASLFAGRHDFGAFRSSGCDSVHAVRFLNSVRVTKRLGGIIEIEAVGKGFMRNMVRIIAGTLVETGSGRMTPAGVESLFGNPDRANAGITAPAHGLTLLKVIYPEIPGPSYP